MAENSIFDLRLFMGSLRSPVSPKANCCWSVNFMHDARMSGQRFRTFNVIDDFSRECLAIEVDTNMPTARVLRVLDRIVAWRGLPEKIRMDNVLPALVKD